MRDVQSQLDALFPETEHEEFEKTTNDEKIGLQSSLFTKTLGNRASSTYAQHFDTRLRFGPATEGQWLRVLPEGKVDATTWFQTVLTFGQLASEVQRHLCECYGLGVEFG